MKAANKSVMLNYFRHIKYMTACITVGTVDEMSTNSVQIGRELNKKEKKIDWIGWTREKWGNAIIASSPLLKGQGQDKCG